MLIIVDGIDGSGKTTLARAIQNVLPGARYLHAGPPTKHPLQEYVKPLEQYTPGAGAHVVCDRWHLGELVWPSIFNRDTRYNDAVHRYVEAFLISRGAVLIACDAPPHRAVERIKLRGDKDVPKEKVLRSAGALFQYAYAHSRVPQISFSFESPVEMSMILDSARLFEHTAAQIYDVTPELVGFGGPLYVGDRLGASLLRPRHRTPFAPYPGVSGEWLMQAMRDPFTLTNATVRRGSKNHLKLLHTLLHEPQVVALGNEAHTKLERLGVEHGVTVHPQYAKRFFYKAPSKYVSALTQAAQGEDTRGWFTR